VRKLTVPASRLPKQTRPCVVADLRPLPLKRTLRCGCCEAQTGFATAGEVAISPLFDGHGEISVAAEWMTQLFPRIVTEPVTMDIDAISHSSKAQEPAGKDGASYAIGGVDGCEKDEIACDRTAADH